MSDKPKMEAQAQGDCDICGEVDVSVVLFEAYSVSVFVCTECLEKAMYLLLDDA